MDPLAVAPVDKQSTLSEQGQVPRYFWLCFFQDRYKLADAKLPFFAQQQHQAEPGFVRKILKKLQGQQ
ncbi:hypothetical protein A628_04676 [Salmonella enterica subsp. enterica serovar Cubana str. 76814]|uniref:Uncharacterized protein n=1 Tax=Salmonella enterica subsp. enterica serovar Cubana str. 76814 TaxID=1192560 RepID=V7IJ67_SALET|nr:hypothetical protein A628_04676 [Salmonella enterica subsp. enterica serovar Cubana str. 76814]